jgi:hypothetical protein
VSIFLALLALLLIVPTAYGQSGLSDPVFSQLPVDSWRTGKQSPLRWSADLVPPELSAFQRIAAGVRIQVESPELPKHNALIVVEFEDAEGARWQTHNTLARQMQFVQWAFLLPGDYSVSVAIYDPLTHDHGFTQKKLHVAPLRNDPLPGAWEALPRVEFIPAGAEDFDAWYLPSITSRLKLPVETHRNVHIDVLVNTTPSGSVTDSLGELRRNMSAVIPALKTISQTELSQGSIDITLVDLTRRHSVPAANRDELKRFFAQTNPGIVDIQALDSQWKMRSFFAGQLTTRFSAGPVGDAHVVIVLSGPAFFPNQEPVAKLDLPADPLRRVFYIRCRLIPHSVLQPRPRPRPGVRPRPPFPGTFRLPLDDLEKPLEATAATLFDVITPEEFRRVLAAVMGQISRL